MRRKYSKLLRIDNDYVITEDTDHEFLYQLQIALLLALKEQEILDIMQYRRAAEKLSDRSLKQERKKYD